MPFKRPLGAAQQQNQRAPNFLRNLQDVKAAAGQQVSLECEIDGVPIPAIKWSKDGQDLIQKAGYKEVHDGNTVSLVILSPKAADAGRYSCQAVNSAGSKTTACVLVITPEVPGRPGGGAVAAATAGQAPTFASDLKHQPLKIGAAIVFECTVQGNPKPQILWFKNNQQIKPSFKHKIENNLQSGVCTLTISSMQTDDVAEYSCRATNQHGQAACSAQVLHKEQYDKWLHETQSKSTQAKQKVMFTELDNTIQQPRQAKPGFAVSKTEKMLQQKYEANGTQQSATKEHWIGDTTSAGFNENQPTRGPGVPPQFSQQLKSIIGNEGQDAIFQCSITGTPRPRIQWLKNNAPLAPSQRIIMNYQGTMVSLQVKMAFPEDNGMYTLIAENPSGRSQSTAQLQVTPFNQNKQGPQQGVRPDVHRKLYGRTEEPDSPAQAAKAPQFARTVNDITVRERQMARFDVKVGGRPMPSVEWYKDGNLLRDSSKHKMVVNQEGLHSLMVNSVTQADAGVYTCRATSAAGVQDTSARLVVQGPVSASPVPQAGAGPAVVEKFQSVTIRESESVTLRCKSSGHQNPTVVWTKDDVSIAPGQSKYKVENKAEESTLQITNATLEDSAWYQCTVTSSSGTTSIRGRVSVQSKQQQQASVPFIKTAGVQLPRKDGVGGPTPEIAKIKQMERQQAARVGRTEEPEQIITQAPQFVSQIRDLTNVIEGQMAHFEVKFTPANDSSLKVLWMFNGRPIQASSRVSTQFEFGVATLIIHRVVQEDSGTYTCMAINKLGQSQTQANLQVVAHKNVVTTTQHPDSMQQIKALEQKRTTTSFGQRDEGVSQEMPNFTNEFRNLEVVEGKPAHFEAKLTPTTDSNLKVEWFFNGKAMQAGSRFKTVHDFGFVALNILSTIPEDSGTYVCRATNLLGVAETVGMLVCHAKTVVTADNMWADDKEWHGDVYSQNPPKFTANLKNVNVGEGGRSHFETRVQPHGDPHLRIDWFKDGMPLQMANRIQMQYDFGHALLNIYPTIPEDSGTYTCVATNRSGRQETSAQLVCTGKETLLLQTQHAGALGQIHQLDSHQVHIGPIMEDKPEEIQSLQAPRFTKRMIEHQETNEGQKVVLDARVQPANDPKMRVDWYKDGQPLGSGHRFRPAYDFGHVTLVLLYAYAEDSGVYTAVASNELGMDTCESQLIVIGKKSLYLDPQHPEGLERIRQLETPRGQEEEAEEARCKGAPRIIGQLTDQVLKEGANLHLVLKVDPPNDPTTHVNWYVNEREVITSNRVNMTNEFGYIVLHIKSMIAEDSGQYIVHVYNDLGETHTMCNVTVQSEASVLTETQHQDSLQQIQHLESLDKFERKEIQEPGSQGPPVFVQPLPQTPQNIEEGTNIHLEARVQPTKDNSMVIEWYKENDVVPTGHRFRHYQDFGFVSLDILSVVAEDSGTYTCYARNSAGEAYSQCEIQCAAKASILSDTDRPTSVQKITELEAPKVAPEEAPAPASQAPKFIRQLADVSDLNEGDTIHLECQVLPADDNKLKIHWLFNGRPLASGHRFQISNDFGFAALNILSVYGEDSGTYTCVAQNESGEASSQCTLTCKSKRSLLLDTSHPDSWQKIQQIEAPKEVAPEAPASPIQMPNFVAQLQSLDNLVEGQTTHLECQVTPVDDPNLKIEWFLDGRPLGASHRYKHIHEFGYIGFDLLHTYPEDTGKYVCRATNEAGSAETTCTLKCYPRHNIIIDPNNPESWKKIKAMEEAVPAKPTEPDAPKIKPYFTQELTGPTEVLKEGQTVHLQCQVQPNNDPTLQMEWLFHKKPLEHASRLRTLVEFGYISMDILHMYPEDSGTYTVRVWNEAGEAETSLYLECKPRRSLYLDAQHVESWAKIQEMENREDIRPPSPEMHFPKPNFTQALQNFDDVTEAEPVRLECRVQPAGDPTLKIQWLVNGQSIPQGSRFRSTHDFDFVALDILTLYPEDSGVYSCRAYSQFGEAVTSCTVKCLATKPLLLDVQHEQSWARIQEIENRAPAEVIAPDVPISAPKFVVPVQDYPEVPEGHPIHLECQLHPTNDPNLVVQWYHNGQALMTGHRFRTTHDFSYVALDILYSFPEDNGTWTCKASNKLGQAETSAKISVQGRHTILADVQHPQSWQRIQEIEAPKVAPAPAPDAKAEAPRILQQLAAMDRFEGQPAHFECRLTPITDPTLQIEWYFNGRPMAMGNRFRPTFDFGFVSLDIAYVHPEDAGTYSVRAVNGSGEAISNAELTVHARDSIISDTHHPSSLQKIQQIEAPRAPAPVAPEPSKMPPKFLTQLSPCTELIEGQPAHFEGVVEPVNDNTLVIEWYLNGNLVQASSRTSMYHEFGLVALDIHYCLPEDVGTYTCRAVNAAGEATSSADLQCKARSAIYLDTLHQQSLEKIRIIEAPKELAPPPEPPTFQKPVFTEPLKNADNGIEGEPIQLECRLIPVKDPKLKIEWYFNEKPLALSNRIMMHQDFGHIILIIASSFGHDAGVYMCRAVNELGEAVTTASVKVQTKASLLLDSQHPESHRKTQILEGLDKFPRIEIPDKVFDKPVIVKPLENLDMLKEGETAHLDCQITPDKDPKLKVEWQHNGKPFPQASRFHWMKDFGMLSLEIDHVIPEDSGVYTCKVSNEHGEAVTSAVVKVEGYESILTDTHHPVSWQKIQDIERVVVNEVVEPVIQYVKPQIIQPLENVDNLPDGQMLQLSARYEPAKDNSMHAEWQHNGQVLMASQLVKTTCELGYASLEIGNAYAIHSGMYTLKLTNAAGEASTSASVKILGRDAVVGDVQHETSWQKIQELEAPKPEQPPAPDQQFAPPSFVKHLNDVVVVEGEPSHFECQFQPAGDPTLQVEWSVNGKPLSAGSKYAINVDFGCVTLDILYTFPEDSGVYMCKAINKAGEAVTSASLKCSSKEAIISSPQNPASAAAVALLEAPKAPAPDMPEPTKMAPVFSSELPNLGDLYEGQGAHFETFVQPVDDPTLTVKWYHNGFPVEASSRVKIVNDFGWVILDIGQADVRDSGEWLCHAYNSTGEAKTIGYINVMPKESIIYDPQQPQSLQRIQDLERPRQAIQPAAPKALQPPKFVTPLPTFPMLEEGDSVHLETQLTPVDDPKMKIQWYKDGKPLMYGHRFRPVNDFGFCILDIMYILPEDTGDYSCIAVNEAGKDTTSAKLECAAAGSLITHSQVGDEKAKAIMLLEESLRRTGPDAPSDHAKHAPVFLEPLQNQPTCHEGDHVYFSAKVSPTNDPELKIQWYLNGKPITTGSRVKTICDFGFAILEISPAYPEDSGEYVCKAVNSMGEAVTKASMTCEGKERIIQATQLPTKMSGAQQKIKILDAPKRAPSPAPDKVFGPPQFKTKMTDLIDLIEGQLAHVECQLEPVADPNLKIEWFHNEEHIFHSSRIKMINEFGFVILEILPAEPHDSGTYTCKATNKYGSDKTTVNIKVDGRSGIVSDWQQPNKKDKIVELEDFLNRVIEPDPAPARDFDPPKFLDPLSDFGEMMEGDSVHFQCKLEPVGDPSMRIEWLHNGEHIPYSSRIQTNHDFGFVILDIKHLIPEDSGEYICRATNSKGHSDSVGKIFCKSKVEYDPPQFSTQLPAELPGIQEADDVHMECRVTPVTDPKLQILWYFNDQPLLTGSRFKMVHDFGYVSLDITHVIAEDSGKYTCKAVNDKGEAVSHCHFVVTPHPHIIYQRQAPVQNHSDLERHIRQYTEVKVVLTEEHYYVDHKQQKPQFVTQLQNIGINEGEFARFECQLAPVNDPNLKVEWFLNGKPITMGHRYLPIHDFGYVALALLYALPDDTGEFSAKAVNKYGSDVTKANLVCAPKKRVITDSQLPQGMSVAGISKLEEQLYWTQTIETEEQPKFKAGPVFTIPPSRVQVYENEPARFACAVTGNPKPKITWYVNGRMAVSGTRYKLSYDGMHYLIIPQVMPQDAGEIVCVARNTMGEAQYACTLDVYQTDDFRSHKLRSVYQISEDEVVLREEQWKQEMLGTLGDAFKKAPKPDFAKLLRMENLAKDVNAPLESEELVNKFQKRREEDIYDKVFSIEHQRPPIPPLSMETVQLKASEVIRRDLPKEEPVKVDLRPAPRSERTETIPTEGPWLKPAVKKPLTAQEESQKYKLKPAVPKEVEVAAKDQVALKTVKPKPAEEPGPETHMQIGKEGKIQTPVQKPAPPKEEILPAASQVSLKPAFKPKDGAAGELTKLEEVQLKSAPLAVKQEEKRDDSMFVKTPAPSQKSTKQPPTFTEKPAPAKVELGRQARFVCKFSGDQPVQVTWLKDGQPIVASFEFQIKNTPNSSTLEINKVKTEYSGNYTARLENVAGRSDSTASLLVGDRPETTSTPTFSQGLTEVKASQGHPARFDVKIGGNPSSVVWFKDGKQVIQDARYKILVEQGLYSLLILEALPQDSGSYECIARNNKGEGRSKGTLSVIIAKHAGEGGKREGNAIPPKVFESLKPIIVQDGKPAKLSARITGVPEPIIKWFRNGAEVKASRFYVLSYIGDVCSLEIAQASTEDEGEYKCEATNSAGKTSCAATLKVTQKPKPGQAPVKEPPKFTKLLQDRAMKVGDRVIFDVAFTGVPAPNVTWMLNGNPLQRTSDINIVSSADSASLTLARAVDSHLGKYTCKLNNPLGQAECSATLSSASSALPVKR